jgi:hypothetical protein
MNFSHGAKFALEAAPLSRQNAGNIIRAAGRGWQQTGA